VLAHSALGVVPLAVYACFHLWQQWPALLAREAWVDRARVWQPGRLVGGLLLCMIAAHAWLGLRRLRRRGATQAEPGPRNSLAGFQAFTGLLLLGFVVFHVLQVWPSAAGPQASVRDAYDVLWTTLGAPTVLVSYVVGVTALAFHLATGLSRFAERLLPRFSRRSLRYVAGLLGLLLWLGYLQLVGRFAIGEGLLPSFTPASEVAASAPSSARPSM
jgi:succinate dehydrogenase/fumarate reductase cytochrome b subunit